MLYQVCGDFEDALVEIGRAEIMCKGSDINTVGMHLMRRRREEAGNVLAPEGIVVELIDPGTLVLPDAACIVRPVREQVGR